jgi:hypothetical protein
MLGKKVQNTLQIKNNMKTQLRYVKLVKKNSIHIT